jgi:hypothetical protein
MRWILTSQGWLGAIVKPKGLIAVQILLAATIGGGVAHANDIYIAQSAAGANNGSSCTSPYAYSFFNATGNWGSGSNQIGPGTTVHICGTIADSLNGTLLTAHGSGASGNPITIQFESGASLQSPGETQFINGNGQSHFVITGVTACGWVNLAEVPCTESIYNTLNGFSGQTCPGGPCVNQVQTTAIGNFTLDLTVRNLLIGPIYIHGGTSDTTFSSPGPVGISFGSGASLLTVNNVIIHDGGWCMNAIVSNLTMYNFEIYYCDHGNGGGQYTDTPNTLSTISIHDGYIHDPYPWDQTNNAFHHDGLHLFSYCATLIGGNNTYCPSTIINNVNIYNMVFGGNWGQNNTANIFFEGNLTNVNLFNNVSLLTSLTYLLANGPFNGYGSNINYFNNTVLGPVNLVNNGNKFSIFCGPGMVVKNNAWTDGGMISTNGPWPNNCPYTLPSGAGGGTQNCTNLSYTLATNAYLAPADFSNGFGYSNCTGGNCTGNGFLNFNASGFATYEAAAPETGGVFQDTTQPGGTWFNVSTGAELTGSPTIKAGTNLSSLCTQNGGPLPNALCSDIAGNARPTQGNWDIGAYQSGSTVPPPLPPTKLTVTVH